MPSLFARPLIGLITFYRWTLSPLVGGHCRYLPTCSQYGQDALRAHGAWAGSWMIAARLCRCRPGGGSGYDPVPPKRAARWWAPWEYGVWKFDPPPFTGEVDAAKPRTEGAATERSAPSVSLRSTAPPQAGEQKQEHSCPFH